eukprot:UN0242
MGWIANPEHFPKGAFWLYRPHTLTCNQNGACGTWTDAGVFSPWDGGGAFAYYGAGNSFVANATLVLDHVAHGDCVCSKGIFTCWNDVLMYAMLAVAVFYGFITGLVVTKFGGVLRAIADNFSLLMVYMVGDPLVNGTNLDDMALNLTALILPLSSQAFSQAAHELKTIQRIKEDHGAHDDSPGGLAKAKAMEEEELESFTEHYSSSDADE